MKKEIILCGLILVVGGCAPHYVYPRPVSPWPASSLCLSSPVPVAYPPTPVYPSIDNSSYKLDQIQWQLEQQRQEQFIQRSQDEFWRMQQQNRNTFRPGVGGSYQWTDGQGHQHGHIPIKGTNKSIDY